MKKVNIEELYNNVHFLLIPLILFLLSFKYYYFIPLLLFYLLFAYKKLYKTLFYIIVFLLIVVSISSIRYIMKKDRNNFEGIIINADGNKYDLLTIYGKVYLISSKKINLGDYGTFETKDITLNTSSLFNYQEYLENSGYKYFKSLNKMEVKDNYFVISKIQNYMMKRSEVCGNTKGYINTLLFGKKDLEESIYNSSIDLGISHLLAISGTHVSVFLFILSFILDKLFYFSKPKNIIIVLFLIFLVFVTNLSISVIRSSFIYLAPIILAKNHKFTKLDYLSMIAIILIIINPKIIYLTSFILSFFVSFLLITFIKFDNKTNKLLGLIKTSFIVFIFTLPVVINLNYEFNIMTIVLSPLASTYFELILIPLSIITYIIPSINNFTVLFFDLYDNFISIISTINFTKIIMGNISIFFIALYFIFLLKITASKKLNKIKWIFSLLLLLTVIYVRPYLNNSFEIKMLDVGQGDSILITYPKCEYVILVDSYNNACDYLKYYGIKKIDLLILTHGDSDHINDFSEVYNTYKPKEIITTKYTTSTELKELINTYNIKEVISGYCNNYIEVLGPINKSESENDNSLVVRINYQNESFLFMGDAEYSEENDLIDRYQNYLESSFLKAGHHGASTSSTSKFLSIVNPSYVLVSVGINNKYGHPNNDYLLNNYCIYRTDTMGTITVRIKNGKITLKKYR